MIDARTLKVRAYKALQAGAGRVGLQVVPKTYYSPIPDLTALPLDVFDRRSALRGIAFDLDAQLAWIEEHLAAAMQEFEPAAEVVDNASYGRVGADLLHGVVRGLKPRRIVELGSGHSTLFMAAAAERNRADGAETELRTFDPYPTVARPGLPGLAALDAVPAQTCRSRSSPRWRPATCCSSTPRTRWSSAPTWTGSCSTCCRRSHRACW